MANLRIIISSTDSAADLTTRLDAQKPAPNSELIDFSCKYLRELSSGRKPGSVVTIMATEVAASGTAQCATVIADDTLTIGAKVLTAKASPANQNQFLVGANNIETAANLVTCINANTGLNTWLSAVSDGVDTVTITCLVPGVQGNNVPLASSGSTIVVSAAFLASGADGVLVRTVL